MFPPRQRAPPEFPTTPPGKRMEARFSFLILNPRQLLDIIERKLAPHRIAAISDRLKFCQLDRRVDRGCGA